jgi:hypothetical protein
MHVHAMRWIATGVTALTALAAATTVQSQEARTLYLQGGAGEREAYATTVGLTWPWKTWSWSLGSGVVRGQWDGYLSNWSSRPEASARRNTLVLGVGPSLRWRAAAGQSPWFVELGTGLSWFSRHYRNGSDAFGSRVNFSSHLGLGRNFGPQRAHELSLRIQHSSNAGLQEPNPGENFLLLRYAHAF